MARLSVRWSADAATFEAQCPVCREFVPLTTDDWRPKNGMSRCGACWAVYFRLKQRGYSMREADREAKKERDALYYRLHRAELQARNRAWKARNRDKIAAYNRAYKERARALRAAARSSRTAA